MDELKIHIPDETLRALEAKLPEQRLLNLNGGTSRLVYQLSKKRKAKR